MWRFIIVMRSKRRLVIKVFLTLLPLVATVAEAGEIRVARMEQINAASGTVLVVVPFVNETGAPTDDWLSTGVAESLASDLSADGRFLVHRHSTVLGSGAMETSAMYDAARQVAEPYGARFVVSGSFQRTGDHIRLTGWFLDVTSGAVLRLAQVDGTFDELFELQDLVASVLASDERATVAQAVPEMPSLPSTDLAARENEPAPAPAAVSIAGAVAETTSAVLDPGLIDGPPAPIPPAVMNRDEQGRTTVRAIRLAEGIEVDGELDEAVYTTVPAITDFIQQVPEEGAPATERTEAWIMFDDTNVYVAARLWDSAPESEWVANEMRRDTNQLRQNDTFAAFFDTFYDRRNGFNFYTNAIGGRADQQFTNEGNPNQDWNPVWDVRPGRFDGGWTVEMEIPFKTLRYRPEEPYLWGIQLRRAIRRKNEWVYLTRIPISAGGGGSAGIFRVSAAGTLVGLEPPPASNNIEVKPYAIGGVTTDRRAAIKDPQRSADFGLDVKYGITQNLTADFTYNTDFAQVEVDEQQVNLTRFGLFFPEKREFFLEGRGIFDFARGGVTGRFGGPGGGFFGGGNAPTLFYSRRIGLDRGRVVPILGGGRVTGKIGQFDVGALNIQTDDEAVARTESTNFTVLRVKRDILRRSAIGGIFTNRSVATTGNGVSRTFGADGTFAFHDAINIVSYVARTQNPGLVDKDMSYQAKLDYAADRYGLQLDHLVVEDNFLPDVGFVLRDNFRRTYAQGRFSPRPEAIDSVRQFVFDGSIDYILTADTGFLETRLNQFRFDTEFETSDTLGFTFSENYEMLYEPFQPGPEVTIAPGGYGFSDVQMTYMLGGQRRVNGQFSIQHGGYFDGEITTVSLRQGRINVLPQMSIEPSVSFNWIDTPQGAFRTDLAVTRVNYAFNPRMFFSGLVQYNSANDTVSNNLRLRWEYSPGSELFVVYTEDRETNPLRPDRLTELRNRGFVVKFNKLFQF